MEGILKNVTKIDVKCLDIWTPYKELYSTVEQCTIVGDDKAFCTLQILLQNHKQDLLNPFQNPPKNEKSRSIIVKGLTEGINIPSLRFPVLSKEITEHLFILSAMYDLDELVALNLLRMAQSQMSNYPGLPRGLVAVLLYYDGHKSLVSSLRTIMQGRSGYRWHTNIGSGIPTLFANFTDELVSKGLIEKIIGILKTKNLAAEFEMLYKNEAVGPPKHRYTIEGLFQKTLRSLADVVFFYSAQAGLRERQLYALIDYLSDVHFEKDAPEGENDVAFTMHLAFLLAIDVSHKEIPFILEDGLLEAVFKKLNSKEKEWACPGLYAFSLFAFAVTIRKLRNFTSTSVPKGAEDKLIASSLNENVFAFLHSTYFRCELIHKEEFYMRRLHGLLTDFIVLMPSVIVDLRAKGEESCKTIRMYMQQSLNPPATLNRHFETFMLCFEPLYQKDPLNLKLHMDYWFDETTKSLKHTVYKSVSHQIALFRFLRTIGSGLSVMLLVSFLKFLGSVIQCRESAQLAFRYLKCNTENCVNWNHFFQSFARYLDSLHVEQFPTTDIIYRHKTAKKEIIPTEIQGLHAVLTIIANVTTHDEGSRLVFYENKEWSVVRIFFGLLSCHVNIDLKANIVKVLAGLCKSEEPSVPIWDSLQTTQLIRTVPSTSVNKQSNFQTELEEVECCGEVYPLTLAVLELCNVLSDRHYPRQLAVGNRSAGFDPFLHYVINVIFLPADSRSYVNPREKYDILDLSMALFLKCVDRYDPVTSNLNIKAEETSNDSQPKLTPFLSSGFQIILDMFTPGPLFRTIMNLISDGCELLETYKEFPMKAALESVTLKCLKLVKKMLNLQPQFLEACSDTSFILNPFSNSLQGLNSRTGIPDHILIITKYIMFNSWLPEHALAAVKILVNLSSHRMDHSMILSFYSSTPSLIIDIRHGFVECLEAEETKLRSTDDEDTVAEIKVYIIQFLLRCLKTPGVNIAYYLLGFNLESIKTTILRQPGYNYPRTCLHSIFLLLNTSLSERRDKIVPRTTPTLLMLTYKALYDLCANSQTSDSMLRFLRASDDVIHQHIQCLPFSMYDRYAEMECMGWLLKTVAIELRVLLKIRQQARLQELCTLLLSETVKINETPFQPFSNGGAEKTSVTVTNCRLYGFHNILEFIVPKPEFPSWQFFNEVSVPKIISMCTDSSKQINVKKLHAVLMDELAANQNLSTSGQRQLIINEITALIAYAKKLNEHEENCMHAIRFIDSYRNLLSVFFSVVSENILPFEERFSLLIELILCLLQKMTGHLPPLPDVGLVISEALLLLFNYTRYCYVTKKNISTAEDKKKLETFFRTFDSHVKQILMYLCCWIVNTGLTSKKVSVNLYASFLIFLHLYSDAMEAHMTRGNLNLDWWNITAKNLYGTFNETLIGVLCKDSINATNICQDLSLTSLGVVIEVEPRWISYLVSSGFLESLGKSLVNSETKLIHALTAASDDCRSLYVYESKMMFFCKLASSREGAECFLRERFLDYLRTMNVYNVHPTAVFTSRSQNKSTLNVIDRYLLIFMPLLKLCKCLLLNSEIEKEGGIVNQIVSLLLNYNETVTLILRNGSPHMESCFMKELADLTFIIMRTFRSATLYTCPGNNLAPFSSGIQKIQNLMISLLISFDMSEASKNIVTDVANYRTKNTIIERTETVVSYLKIIYHVLLYAEKIISESKVGRFITQPLFEPIVKHNLHQPGFDYAGYYTVVNIGVIVQCIVDGVSYCLREKVNLNGLVSNMEKLPSMKIDEIKEALPFLNLFVDNEQYVRNQANVSLEKLICLKNREITTCYMIVETALFILWTHLDYYMLQILPTKGVRDEPSMSANPLEMQNASWKVSVKQINELQKYLITVFHESFTTKLMLLTEDKPVSVRSYVDGLISRIKKLIQFVPNN